MSTWLSTFKEWITPKLSIHKKDHWLIYLISSKGAYKLLYIIGSFYLLEEAPKKGEKGFKFARVINPSN